MRESTVSVVMATYNGEKYVREQLESILKQDMLPNEIIISDDGSTDETVSIINDIISNNKENVIIKLISNNVNNKGVAANFENAILNSTGDIVFLSDQDDIWHEDKISTVCGVFKEKNDAVAVIHDAQVFQENDSIIQFESFLYQIRRSGIAESFQGNFTSKLEKKTYLDSSIFSTVFWGMCMAFKGDFVRSTAPFPRTRRNHDGWLCFCAVEKDGLYAVNKSLADYRVHESNTCGISSVRKKENLFLMK